ncbi:amidohydrolase family protein [Synechococcus sp. CS-602]|nr:amidohydrolase family protein [Synechococcus sp. CS-603]MCT0204466.1 amidohydrolase family protein [Synechococcus sp. CS-602]TWB96603.1 cytosine deaminase [Synechococcus sp. Ace-Pa]
MTDPTLNPAQVTTPDGLPPLRLPRSLLDPLRSDLPRADGEGLVSVRLGHSAGRITSISAYSPQPGELLPLALTPLLEPHAHLDKAFTWERHPNGYGTMAGALAANQQEHLQRSQEQVWQRGERGLQQAWRQGSRAMRSHVDSAGPAAEASWEALLDLQQRWQQRLTLQLVALVPVGHWATTAGARLARRLASRAGPATDGSSLPILLGGVLGAPFSADAGERAGLQALLRLADELGCGVDLHVDESSGEGGSAGAGVALVARLVREQRIAIPVTCSHSASMSQLSSRRCLDLADVIAEAGLAVVALPPTNLWLLGHHGGDTPNSRPMAPIRQLQRAGVTVAIGGDNVQDPWFPGGDFDPLELLRLSVTAAHLAPWQRQGLMPFTTAAARLMGLAWDGVLREGAPADLILLAASNWSDLLARCPQRRVLRQGQWLPPLEAPALQSLLDALPVG